MTSVLVVADDMSGGNATGARLARIGLSVATVSWRADLVAVRGSVDVLVVDTASRDVPAAEAATRVRQVIEAVGAVDLVVKRVDTTLRGNVGVEISAALGALRARADPPVRALMVPAFPDAGRITVGGIQLVDGRPVSPGGGATAEATSHVATIVASGGAAPTAERDPSVAEVALDDVVAGGARLTDALRADADVLVCDALTPSHLVAIASAAAEVSRTGRLSWMCVDSGAFAPELVTALAAAGRPAAPVLAVVGSVTDVTAAQLTDAERSLDGRFVELEVDASRDSAGLVDDWWARVTAQGWTDPAFVGVRTRRPGFAAIPRPPDEVATALGELARRLLVAHNFGALYLSGGDVAAAVLSALGAYGLRPEAEVLPLAVAGRIAGGAYDGLPVVTKGGLIGHAGAATMCLARLRALATVPTQRIRDTSITAEGATNGNDEPK